MKIEHLISEPTPGGLVHHMVIATGLPGEPVKEALELILNAWAGGKKAYIRYSPAVWIERTFDSPEVLQRGRTRFAVSSKDETVGWEYPRAFDNEADIFGFGLQKAPS